MLLCVCVAFVCLRLPYTVSYALYEYTKDPGDRRSPVEDLPYFLASQITDVVATTNYMVNFFLYGLCGSYFRQQVRAAFSCGRHRGGRGARAAGRLQSLQYTSGSRYSTAGASTRLSVASDTMHLNAYKLPSPHA